MFVYASISVVETLFMERGSWKVTTRSGDYHLYIHRCEEFNTLPDIQQALNKYLWIDEWINK
jgi:hypothetical protein